MSAAVSVPGARVALSTASVYPEGCAAAFRPRRARLGYDGVEVMVWTDPVSQEPGALRGAVRAPRHTGAVGARADPPAHPAGVEHRPVDQGRQVDRARRWRWAPTRWCCTRRSGGSASYAREFVDGVALREHETGIRLAVENMFPWRARNREYSAYLPGWDPVPLPYANVTLDLSHTATAGSDALQMADDLGPRLTHVHLADGTGSAKDEHLVPGRGGQPCAEFLETLATQGYSGTVVVEVGTRKLVPEEAGGRPDGGARLRPAAPCLRPGASRST